MQLPVELWLLLKTSQSAGEPRRHFIRRRLNSLASAGDWHIERPPRLKRGRFSWQGRLRDAFRAGLACTPVGAPHRIGSILRASARGVRGGNEGHGQFTSRPIPSALPPTERLGVLWVWAFLVIFTSALAALVYGATGGSSLLVVAASAVLPALVMLAAHGRVRTPLP